MKAETQSSLSPAGSFTIRTDNAGRAEETDQTMKIYEIHKGMSVPDDSRPASDQYTHYNVVKISGGKVSVTEASCKNQVCVHHGAISSSGESIICLPNRLVVRIDAGDSEEGGGYDSVTS